jgi:hypothetical protein
VPAFSTPNPHAQAEAVAERSGVAPRFGIDPPALCGISRERKHALRSAKSCDTCDILAKRCRVRGRWYGDRWSRWGRHGGGRNGRKRRRVGRLVVGDSARHHRCSGDLVFHFSPRPASLKRSNGFYVRTESRPLRGEAGTMILRPLARSRCEFASSDRDGRFAHGDRGFSSPYRLGQLAGLIGS